MSEFDPTKYTITIKRVVEDGELLYKATIKEMPHAVEFGDSYEEVYQLAIDALSSAYSLAMDMGHSFPNPIEDQDEEFSGRVTLRMPKTLHRQIATLSDQENVSLNQYIVTILSAASSNPSKVFGIKAEPKITITDYFASGDPEQAARLASYFSQAEVRLYGNEDNRVVVVKSGEISNRKAGRSVELVQRHSETRTVQ